MGSRSGAIGSGHNTELVGAVERTSTVAAVTTVSGSSKLRSVNHSAGHVDTGNSGEGVRYEVRFIARLAGVVSSKWSRSRA